MGFLGGFILFILGTVLVGVCVAAIPGPAGAPDQHHPRDKPVHGGH